jgi:AcrR family transcriptional regulator
MSSDVPPPRRRDATATRAAILAAAVEEFTEYGYTGAGVRQIAERAGVTAMLINRYFGSKEKLFAEVVDTSFAPPTVVATETDDIARDLGRALAAQTAQDDPQLAPFLLMLRSAADPKAAEIIREGIENHVGHRFAGLLAGPNADARAQVGLSLVAGIWLMRKVLAIPALTALDDESLGDLLARMFAAVTDDR